ncbi:MAG TPA: rhomboid family intramembrane serine protease [Herpetosiphonaceae bacterium]
MYPAPPPALPPDAPRTVTVALPSHPVRLTWLIFALNFAMYGLAVLRGFSPVGNNDTDVLVLIEMGAKYTPLMDLGGEWWRLLAPVALHGGLLHLLVNSYALYSLSPQVEQLYGSLRLLAIYVVSGLAGSVGSYAFGPIGAPSIGASGALFGLMGALGAFAFSSRNVLGDLARRNLAQVVGLAIVNLAIGAAIPGIDNFAHVGGLIGGVLVGAALTPRLRLVNAAWNPQLEARPSHPLGWLAVVAVALAALALAWYFHQQHLANDLTELRDYLEAYQFEIQRFR